MCHVPIWAVLGMGEMVFELGESHHDSQDILGACREFGPPHPL